MPISREQEELWYSDLGSVGHEPKELPRREIHGEADVIVRSIFAYSLQVLRRVLDAQSHDGQAIAVLLAELEHVGKVLPTRNAPGGPELDQDGLAQAEHRIEWLSGPVEPGNREALGEGSGKIRWWRTLDIAPYRGRADDACDEEQDPESFSHRRVGHEWLPPPPNGL